MRALELLAVQTRQALDASKVFDENGDVADPKKLQAILDLPMACMLVMDIRLSEYFYMNRRLAKKIEMEAGLFAPENQHRMTHNFDPSTVMHVFNVLQYYSDGNTGTIHGIMTIGERSNMNVLCDVLVAPLAFDRKGTCTYAANFFVPMVEQSLLNVLLLLAERSLTPKQWEACALLVNGLSHVEIAKEMGISVKTLEKHLGAIFAATKCQNQTALVSELRKLD